MKYGKYLEERRSQLEEPFRTASIEYKPLKRIIRPLRTRTGSAWFPKDYTAAGSSLDSILVPNFPQLVHERLDLLNSSVVLFLTELDSQVLRLNACYVEEVAAIRAARQEQESSRTRTASHAEGPGETEASAASHALLERIVSLENFVVLNYTGIIKILKKLEKHTNLNIRSSYLYRIAMLPVTKNLSLAELKSRLVSEVAASSAPQKRPRVQHEDTPAILQSAVFAANGPTSTSSSSGPLQLFKAAASQRAEQSPKLAQRIVVTVTGSQGTDILGCMVRALARYKSVIHDVSLARVHHAMTVGALVALHSDDVDVFRELTEDAARLNAVVNFEIPSASDHTLAEPELQQRLDPSANFVVTLVAPEDISAQALSDTVNLFIHYGVAVLSTKRLSERCCRALEMSVGIPETPEITADLSLSLRELATSYKIDIHLQKENVFRRHKRLVLFDMDSTLIQQEVIDELAALAGKQAQVSQITAEAMSGKLDFQWSLRKRVELLGGHPSSYFDVVRDNLELTNGALTLCRSLKRLGCILVVVSGGFLPLAEHIKSVLGLDYCFANTLEVDAGGNFTGQVVGDIVDAKRKAQVLNMLAEKHGIDRSQILAVGDGANDLLMLADAGVGVAFRAKPIVQERAPFRVNDSSLATVLYMLGFNDEDIRRLLEIPDDASLVI